MVGHRYYGARQQRKIRRLGLDTIDETILREKPLKEILVNYDAEVLLGEEVKLYNIYQDTDEGTMVYIQGMVEEKAKFSVKLVF